MILDPIRAQVQSAISNSGDLFDSVQTILETKKTCLIVGFFYTLTCEII
jgi:hypothetical protein